MINKILKLYYSHLVTIVQPDLSQFIGQLLDTNTSWYIRYGRNELDLSGIIKELTVTAETGRLLITVTEVLT